MEAILHGKAHNLQLVPYATLKPILEKAVKSYKNSVAVEFDDEEQEH